jgi:hypothetical protein
MSFHSISSNSDTARNLSKGTINATVMMNKMTATAEAMPGSAFRKAKLYM